MFRKAYFEIRQGDSFCLGQNIQFKQHELPNIEKANSRQNITKDLLKVIDNYCPHVMKEIEGYCHANSIEKETLPFFNHSYIYSGCSQLAIANPSTSNDASFIARNYDFDDKIEDLCIVKYQTNNTYSFIGSTMLTFGIDSGVNEYGLAISMSSCGLPVGAFRKPSVDGIRFWLTIRIALERCKTVYEVIDLFSSLPLGDNVSYMCMDLSNTTLLYQVIDGVHDRTIANSLTDIAYLYVTNHPTLSKTIEKYPFGARNSIERYNILERYVLRNNITLESVRKLFVEEYPNGLRCNFYEDFFGTTKSMILNPKDQAIEVCWFGNQQNEWLIYSLEASIRPQEYKVFYNNKKAPDNFFSKTKLVR